MSAQLEITQPTRSGGEGASRRWSSAAARRACRSATASPGAAPFVILDANARVGDSLARALGLAAPVHAGAASTACPACLSRRRRHSFPTKDEMADYLEAYAARFGLPVRTGVRVDALVRRDGRVRAWRPATRRFEADHVVVAMAQFQEPNVPGLRRRARPRHHAAALERVPQSRAAARGRRAGRRRRQLGRGHRAASSRDIRQVFLSGAARRPHPVRNRGARRAAWSSRCCGRSGRTYSRTALRRTEGTAEDPDGQEPLIRVKPKHLAAAGVELVPARPACADGLPVLEDRRVLDVASVDLVHRLPTNARLDRPAGARRGLRARDRSLRRSRVPARALPGRAGVPLRVQFTHGRGSRARCKAHRRADRLLM